MPKEELGKASHWILRSMEWDDTRAKYPNIWQEGMPRHVLAAERLARRLRLGDLIAVYYPSSTKHSRRSERYLGISRVVGLRGADDAGSAWIDLETAHRFREPLDIGRAPGRVFLCCDPEWPARDVSLFRDLLDEALNQGWKSRPHELPAEKPAESEKPAERKKQDTRPAPEPRTEPEAVSRAHPVGAWAAESDRLFGGAHFSGDMRDPREGTWLAVVALSAEALRVIRLEATGRTGLQALLRNLPRDLMHAEAIGMGFPFGLPVPFAESLMGGPFPEEGWWALARRLERATRPEFLVALQEFRDAHGEILRVADERAGTLSPLHRVEPDMGSRFYHGVRMVAEDRSRFAIRPFETAQGKLLFEVHPQAALRRLGIEPESKGDEGRERLLTALEGLQRWPLTLEPAFRRVCRSNDDALEAVIAARCAAVAVETSEVEKTAAELAPEDADRVRVEGWVYGLEESG